MDNNKKIVEIRFGGFTTLLTVALIILKLTDVITWSWWLVFLPMIISWGLVLLLLLIVGIVTIFR